MPQCGHHARLGEKVVRSPRLLEHFDSDLLFLVVCQMHVAELALAQGLLDRTEIQVADRYDPAGLLECGGVQLEQTVLGNGDA